MAKREKPLVRPLSPFMHYVNGQTLHTMGLSILHRITGVALTVGSILLVYGLVAAASGAENYAAAQQCFSSVWIQSALVGWLFSFCYHFLNGIRHLVWDTGRGFELATARKSGYAVFFAALIVTAILVVLFVRAGGAA
jgi:succinate dehydrogenase / fumarate reductase, cytochrome b subunit